jgi:hypothetical protein
MGPALESLRREAEMASLLSSHAIARDSESASRSISIRHRESR